MFNLLLALIIGLVVGWNFHAFFIQLNPPHIFKNEINTSKVSQKVITKQEMISQEDSPKSASEINRTTIASIKVKETSPQQDSFYSLLEKNLFSDAMAHYLDANIDKLPTYRSTLLNYFQTKSTTKPKEAIQQMVEFIELEPEHKAVSLELIKTYKSTKTYKKAIETITKLSEMVSASELELLHGDLIETSQHYIDELKRTQNFKELLTFLHKRIELGIKTPFYIYTLAHYYVDIQKYDEAIVLLKEIEYDYDYGPKVKNLLALIQKKINQENEYPYQLHLNKTGEHFTIDAHIENTPLTLLLDTGATLTMVNASKLSSLPLIKDHILLNTAGGEIDAQLKEADTFSIGEIQLEKFQVVSASFEQEDADGLLGMNFFKKFKFKIDQENALLHLSPKDSELEENASN